MKQYPYHIYEDKMNHGYKSTYGCLSMFVTIVILVVCIILIYNFV